MAGPRFLATGGVVDPYAGLQNAVSQVGGIYQNYAENERREAEFKAQEDERNRIKSMREFTATYDPRVGDDYRGINAGMQPLVEQAETQARQRWQAANPNATAEQVSAFDKELLGARRSLVSSEDVAAIVTDDLVRAGVPYQDAIARGQLEASKYSSRGAALAQAQAEADARNKAADAMSDRLLKMHEAQSRIDAAAMRAVGGSSSGGGGSRTGSTGKPGIVSSSVSPEEAAKLQKFMAGRIGGVWPDVDTPAAMQNFMTGLDSYNRKAAAAGGRPLPFSEAQSLMISSIDEGIVDADVTFQTPEELETLLTDQYGVPGTANTQGTGGGSGSSSDRQALIAGMRSKLSAAEREAILSPSRAIVDPQQVMRQQVAAAYVSMYPQAAQENRAVVERALSPTPSPSRSVAAPTNNVRSRYEVKPPPLLTKDQTRGEGYRDLETTKPQGNPAGVTSSPERQVSDQPVSQSRQIALAAMAASQPDSPQAKDSQRLLQKLEIDNPELYGEVQDQIHDLRRKQTSLNYTNNQVRDLTAKVSAEERRLQELDPETISTVQRRASWLGDRTSDYQEYLRDKEQLEQTRETLKNFQIRQTALRDELGVGTEPDFTVLRSLLK